MYQGGVRFSKQLICVLLKPLVFSIGRVNVEIPFFDPWIAAWQLVDPLIAPAILVTSPIIICKGLIYYHKGYQEKSNFLCIIIVSSL